MTGLPPPTKIAGAHTSIYEGYYKLMDPKNEGKIAAPEAAKFLKKSHLSDAVLSEIWDIADPNSHGYLDKSGVFVALKLCALAQQGHNLSVSNLFMDIPPPKMEEVSSSCWSVSPSDRKKYEQLFLSLEPINGYIPGNKVKGILMDSKLPLETLGKIWDLADMDSDGRLNLHEFIIAMHLVYVALEKNTVPTVLPAELADGSKNNANNNNLNLNTFLSANLDSSEPTKNLNTDEWVVSREDILASDTVFKLTDKDMDGFVSGGEIKDIFMDSGLPQTILAHIWNLCDIYNTGKLNSEQFALARWLMKQKLNGSELPNKLTNEMIPPCFRKNNRKNIENNNVDTFANQELNMINREISEIIKERHIIEQDIAQNEADIQIKTGAIKTLQSELDSVAETLRLLTHQEGVARKELGELEREVENLREIASEQESTLRREEEELNAKRQEMKTLKSTENKLQSRHSECNSELNNLFKQLQNQQLQISQIKANMTQLEELQRRIINATAQFDAALVADNALLVSESALTFKANLDESLYTSHISTATSKPKSNDQKNTFIKNDLKSKNDQNIKQNRYPFEAKFPSVAKGSVKDAFGDDPFALHTPLQVDSPGPALPPKQSRIPPPRPAPRRPAQTPATKPRSSVAKSPVVSRRSNVDPSANKSASFDDVKGTADFADFANFNSAAASITNEFIAKCKLEESFKYNNPTVVSNVNDFDEDPFVNYRYEDLAMISDPFAEDNEDFKRIKSKGISKNNK